MRNRQINQALRRAVQAETPDVLNQVLSADLQKEISTMEYQKKISTKRKRTYITAACSLAALFVIGFFSVFLLSQPKVDSLISLDVNPGIEISTDDDDRVLGCRALNSDAEKVLDNMDLQGVTLNVASNAIIGSMVKQGYLTAGNANTILVSVANDDAEKAAKLQQEFTRDIHTVLKAQGIQATVYQQSESTPSGDLKSFADQYHISIGKADFIRKLMAKDSSLDAQTLASMSIKQLANLIAERGIFIGDIVTEYDDDLEDMIEDTIEDTNEMNGVGDDLYCEYCGRLTAVCKNSCDKSGGEQYCDDCGRLHSVCRDRCQYHGGNGTNNQQDNDSVSSSSSDANNNNSAGSGVSGNNHHQYHHQYRHGQDDDYDDDEYCKYCGKLESICRDSCNRSGGKQYCEDCGRLNSICNDSCDDDYDDDEYCEYCGKLESICRDSCNKSGGKQYCEDCGRLNSICNDSCDD